MYARMVELILGIPCVGLGLCHIGSPFVKNKYGMPYRDKNNQYPIDENGTETVKWFNIKYRRKEADAVLADRLVKVKANINKNTIQKSLFDL